MKLHLGCGGFYKEDYINIDLYPKNFKVDRVYDCSEALDYPENSVEEITSTDFFEHIPRAKVPMVLKNWYQVLKKRGNLIIEVPDLDGIVRLLNKNPNDEQAIKYLYGVQDREGQLHYWAYNKESLELLLKEAGFSKIEFTESQDYRYKDDGMPSIRVEAKK